MTFLLVDDHPLIRSGLRQLLESGFKGKVAEAQNGTEALPLFQKQRYDVVILDLELPGKSGLDLLRDIRAINPQQKILILSMHAEEQLAVRVLRAGAAGFVTKESAAAELATAIRKIVEGGKYVSPRIAELLVAEVAEERPEKLEDALSDREFEVMRRIASGESISGIAESLSLSVKTVSTYRSRILEKLNLHSNAEMAIYAVKCGLITP